jgi:hypothetical protein
MLIKVRGVTYGSVKEAAEALGVNFHSVYSALNRGGLEKLGLGKTKPKPVTIGNTTFRSMTAASVALGLGRSYLEWAMREGGKRAKDRVAFAMERYKAREEITKAIEQCGKGKK